MNKVAVFGYSKNIGTALVEILIKKEIEIVAIGRTVPIWKNMEYINWDLNEKRVPDFLRHLNIDGVVYLAQSEHYKDMPRGLKDLFFVNIYNPYVISEWCNDNDISFVYASTGSVYKESSSKREDDLSDLSEKLNPYTASKLQAEQLIQSVNPKSLIIRPFTVFGRNMSTKMFFMNLHKSILEEKPIKLPVEGQIVLSPTPSNLVAKAIIHLMNKHHGIFNVAGQESVSLQELAIKIAKIVKKEVKFVGDPSISPFNLTANIAKLKASDFKGFEALDDSLREYFNQFV